jgi:hypothetical protein
MAQVNTETQELEPVKKKPMGKKALPIERRRVILSVRVLPSTMEYLKNMNYRTVGRALDIIVKAIQHRGVTKMIDAGIPVDIVNISE